MIFILTDDQGYGDMACHGNPFINTPSLDRLHEVSTCFTNFHVGTTCSPSRAGLLSGQYSNKVGAWHTIKGRQILSAKASTMANAFQGEGYKTGIFGKWHLGDSYPFRPQDRGFEEVLIHKGGAVGNSPDYWNNDYFDDTYFHNGKPEKFLGYCTDVWFDEAIEFISKNKTQPFFCYLAVNAPHDPFHIEKKYSNPYKRNHRIPDANFYGMISNIDENIGKLRVKLKELGIDENTILIFMTDNGTDAGVEFDTKGKLVSGFNAGMRGVKGSPYEGGHRVPFFIYWPAGHINKRREIDELTSYVDFMPTILELCNINIASNDNIDGLSLVPLIKEANTKWPDRFLFVDTQREEFLIKDKDACVMSNQWRLIKVKSNIELYDIKNDPGQRNDVSLLHADVVKVMNDAYEEWWTKVSANKDKYNRYIIGSDREEFVVLSSHDCHSEDTHPASDQNLVREGNYENGFWSIEVAATGIYNVELRRWPKESGLHINAAAPMGDVVPGGEAYSVGKKMNYQTAQISLEDEKFVKKVKPNESMVQFTLTLSKGDHNLSATFTDAEGKTNNAYYVYINRK